MPASVSSNAVRSSSARASITEVIAPAAARPVTGNGAKTGTWYHRSRIASTTPLRPHRNPLIEPPVRGSDRAGLPVISTTPATRVLMTSTMASRADCVSRPS